MLSPNLEQTLHRALAYANERRHEYATLEHLLLALTDDQDAIAVLRACSVDLEQLRRDLSDYVDNELASLVGTHHAEAKPTAGFQRVLQRAAIHVQSSGREEVTGANVLVALFSERESHAVYFLQEQDMTRLDAVNYISHGIAKAPGRSEARRVQRRRARTPKAEAEVKTGSEALEAYCVNLNKKAQGRQDRSADRPRAGGRAHHPDPLPPHQEQPALCRRSRRRQDRHRRGPGAPHRRGRRAGGAEERHHLRARHGRAAGRHALSRRFRGAAEGGGQASWRRPEGAILFIDEIHTVIGAGATSGGAMDASNLLKPALQSGTLRCIGSTTYKEYRNYFEKDRALVRRFQKIDVNEPSVEDAVKILRGLKPYYEKHHKVRYTARGDPRRGRAVGALHQRPQAARQGDRRDRRGRRGADAAAGEPSARRPSR